MQTKDAGECKQYSNTQLCSDVGCGQRAGTEMNCTHTECKVRVTMNYDQAHSRSQRLILTLLALSGITTAIVTVLYYALVG